MSRPAWWETAIAAALLLGLVDEDLPAPPPPPVVEVGVEPVVEPAPDVVG